MLKQTYYTFKAPEMIKVFLGFLSYDIHNVNESCISKETRRLQIYDRYSVNRVAGLGRLSVGANMAMKPFVKRVIKIFATNASFLRVISNFRI